MKKGRKTDDELSPGDTIEYGMTIEKRNNRQGSYWLKFGATSTIRDGESTEAATERVVGYVNTMMGELTDALD